MAHGRCRRGPHACAPLPLAGAAAGPLTHAHRCLPHTAAVSGLHTGAAAGRLTHAQCRLGAVTLRAGAPPPPGACALPLAVLEPPKPRPGEGQLPPC